LLLGKVIGNVVATAKHEGLSGGKLLIVQPIDGNYQPQGSPMIAMDSVGAGTDEIVMLVQSKEASVPFGGGNVPTDAAIIGIVDGIGRN
jgi:ethanolamine utilization protein EutN